MSLLAFYLGDDVTLNISASTDLTGTTVYWMLKQFYSDPDSAALITCVSPTTITILGSTATVTLTAAQTAVLPTAYHLVWSLRDKDGGLLKRTLAEGTALVRPVVQRTLA